MHNGFWIIFACVAAMCRFVDLLKIVLLIFYNIVPDDLNMLMSVTSILFVGEPKCMNYFVNYCTPAKALFGIKVDWLIIASFAKV